MEEESSRERKGGYEQVFINAVNKVLISAKGKTCSCSLPGLSLVYQMRDKRLLLQCETTDFS
jgi:hypothetical protein